MSWAQKSPKMDYPMPGGLGSVKVHGKPAAVKVRKPSRTGPTVKVHGKPAKIGKK